MGNISSLPDGNSPLWDRASSIKKVLYEATKSGEMQNLANNLDAINDIVAKRQADIRRGMYDRQKRLADYYDIVKKNKDLTEEDKREIRKILDHWG